MSHLNETQRYTIYRMRRDKKTQTEIARAIGVSQATVSKELSRNADSSGKYSPAMAQIFADMAKERSHRGRKKLDEKMESFIRQKMERYQWSPEQIKGYCEANGLKMVSFERIYQLIRQDKREGRFGRIAGTDSSTAKGMSGLGWRTYLTGFPYIRDHPKWRTGRSLDTLRWTSYKTGQSLFLY